MKSLKKLLAILLAGTMAMGTLAACGSDSGGTNQDTEAATESGGENETEDAPETTGDTESDSDTGTDASGTGIDSWTAFDENVTITVPVYDRGTEGLPAVDDNYYTKWIQENFGDKYNVTVEFVAIPRTDVMTKYSMLIAAGDTPTILMEYDYPKVAQWASDGAMQVIDLDAFAEIAPDYYNNMVELEQLQYTDINGESYFVLSERPYYDTTYTYATFYRTDWIEAVNMEEPTNYEEYVAVVEAIVEAGLCDEYPLGLNLPTAAYVGNFGFRDYPVDEAEWAMHSSLGTASLSWEPTYEMLKRTNAEYNDGWYSTEFELDISSDGQAGEQKKADFINGNIFEYGGYMSASVDWLTAFYENNPDATLGIKSSYTVVEEGVADYPQIRADNPFGMIVGFSSNATEDELTAAWMYMEWMFQEENLFYMENGVEGETFNYDADGNIEMVSDYDGDYKMGHNMNIDYTCIVHASKKQGTIEETIASISPQGLAQDFTQELIDNYYELREIADNGWAYSDPVFAVDIAADAEYSGTLLSLYQEYYVQLVKCSTDEFDALYDELSQKYLDAGYQEVIDERLAAYEAGNTTKLPEGHGQ